MPKRQQNRSYKDKDATEERSSRPAANAEGSILPTIKREFMLTPLADDGMHEAIRVLSRGTGTTLSKSHFLRILIKVIASAIPDIEREVSELGKLKRPANTRESQVDREEYEQQIAQAVAAALKTAPPPGMDTGSSRKGRDPGKRPA
jgi:hypothetical protein